MGRYTLSLSSRKTQTERTTGGKGASLAWLQRNDFRVPSGFVVTAEAFQRFCHKSQLDDLAIRFTESDREAAQKRILESPIPCEVCHAVLRSYRALGGQVAVRSSLVGEDSLTASLAGQLDSFLDVEGQDSVLESIRLCWASLLGKRMVSYAAARQGNSHGPVSVRSLSLAVVVQRMVKSLSSGVAFSRDPISGQHLTIIEAVTGRCDKLVQGLLDADRYVVDGRGHLGIVQPVLSGRPVLSERQCTDLASVVQNIARQRGLPQDIEWTWDGANFWVLQARPITSLVGRRIYSNRMVSDMCPGLIAPLLYSTNTVSMAENVLGRVFTELLGPSDTDFTQLTRRINSRLYTDVTLLGELFQKMGLPPNFFEVIGRDERGTLQFNLRTTRAAWRLLRFSLRHSRAAAEIRYFLSRHDQDLEPYRRTHWVSDHPTQLFEALGQLRLLHQQTQWYTFIASTNMSVRNRIMRRMVRKHAPDVLPADLLRGIVGLKGLAPTAALQRIATRTADVDPVLLDWMCSDDRDPAAQKLAKQALASTPNGKKLIEEVDGFLDQFGFLSANGTDFTQTPWVEAPFLIWRAIVRLARQPIASSGETTADACDRAQARVRQGLQWPQRALFDHLLASTSTYIDLRERVSLFMSEDAYQMRRVVLALGDYCVRRGIFRSSDDIFYLMYEEIHALANNDLASELIRTRVEQRRAEMAADAHVVLPNTICGDFIPTADPPASDQLDVLTGIPVSSGRIEGTARVIYDPRDAPSNLSRSDILIVPFTDVGWTPLFPGIGGIVAETGGQLSHTAIVAREYGLPAVVSVKEASTRIRDGQHIVLDGNSGSVYLG